MSENLIYTDNRVSISTSRIVIGSTTYPLRNIASVRMGFTPPHSGCAGVVIILGGLILLGGIATARESLLGSLLIVGVGVLVGTLGFLCLRTLKATYSVLLINNSGEVKALESEDEVYLETIIESINNAIVQYR